MNTENKNNSNLIKREELEKEVLELTTDLAKVKSDLRAAESEEKLENHKKNALELKKEYLSQSIEFYKRDIKKRKFMLSRKLMTQSKFSMASSWYDKLLETYSENFIQNNALASTETTVSAGDNNDLDILMLKLRKEVEGLEKRIEENRVMAKALLEDLEYSVQ